LNQE
jgi:2-C-methyl-D-erythritol 4-phosphate cytidylyltransferase